MLGLLQRLKERKAFLDTTAKAREEERARSLNGAGTSPAVFNRRIFSIGTIAITATAARVMKKNELLAGDHSFQLTDSERLVLKNIVESMRLIHRGRSHVKLAIANCITHETHRAFEHVHKWPAEAHFSCYYVLQGSLEATYEPSSASAKAVHHQMFQPDIVYTHGMGEFLGLLTHGDGSDLAPPGTLYCKTDCELLRIDRAKFHALMDRIEDQLRREIDAFLGADWNFLAELTDAEKAALAPHLVKETLRSDSLVLKQGERNEWLYFLTSGRCQGYRMLSFQESGADRTEAFALRTYEKGDMFGEESPLDGCPSSLSVCTKSQATVYRLHRSQLTVVGRQHLCRLVREHSGSVPTDAELRERRTAVRTWQAFREETVTAVHTGGRENFSRIKRIQSAPSSISAKTRHLEFIEGEVQSRIFSGLPRKAPVKPAPGHTAARRNSQTNEPRSVPKVTIEIPELPTAAPVAARKKLLSSTVSQFIMGTKLKTTTVIDSREIYRKFANKDYENRVKQGWIFAADAQNDDLAANYFSGIDTGELVARADTAAREQAERVQALRTSSENSQETEWRSGLETDHAAASVGLAFNRLRIHTLKRRMQRWQRSGGGHAPSPADSAGAAGDGGGAKSNSDDEFDALSKKSHQRRRNAARFVEYVSYQPLSASMTFNRPLHQQQQLQLQPSGDGSSSGGGSRRNALETGRLWVGAKPSGERFIDMYNSSRKISTVSNDAEEAGMNGEP